MLWLLVVWQFEKQREHILFQNKIQIKITPVSCKALEENIQERSVKNEF